MICRGSFFHVIDNSGAIQVKCIHHYGSFKQRFIRIGDVLLVVVKNVRTSQYVATKTKKELETPRPTKPGMKKDPIKKGEILFGLVTHIRDLQQTKSNFTIKFFQVSVVLLKKTNKTLVGTRILGSLPKSLRSTSYMRILTLSSGLC